MYIGSIALKNYVPLDRNPNDIDIIDSHENFEKKLETLKGKLEFCVPRNNGKKIVAKKGNTFIEAEISWENSLAKEFIEIMNSQGYYEYASLNGLYTLKMSHRYLKNSYSFLKTMNDIHIMRSLGAYISEDLKEWYKKRKNETYDYNHPNLNKTKNDFFSGDNIIYYYDHDTIHKAMAHYDKPAYEFFKLQQNDVLPSKNLFFECDEKTRLFSVLEEAYVLALERSQIPYPNFLTPKQSFDIALMKICTSITSGWFREFAWENYYKVQSLYTDDYIRKFHEGITNKTIKSLM